MAGLLAWAADVVRGGGNGRSDDENDPNSIPLIFTTEQLTYVQQLDRKSASLNRSIEDLRLRLPPPDISQRLPDLYAHSLTSNNALALQLNSHSVTKQQTQLREVRLRQENEEYQKAMSNYEIKIQQKLQEADLLRSKLKEMDLIEQELKVELQTQEASMVSGYSEDPNKFLNEDTSAVEAQEKREASKSALMEKLEKNKKELASIEEIIQELEKKWQEVQDNALKHPTRDVQEEKEMSSKRLLARELGRARPNYILHRFPDKIFEYPCVIDWAPTPVITCRAETGSPHSPMDSNTIHTISQPSPAQS